MTGSGPTEEPLDPHRVREEVLGVVADRTGEDAKDIALVLRGVVRQGVEWRSVVLHTDDGRAFQLGGAFAGYEGREVRVTGRTRTGVFTTTQEGTPLTVDAIDAIDGRDPVS